MSYAYSLKSPLQSVFLTNNSKIKSALWVLAGVFLLAFASQLNIPFRPIPLTFQSVTVILIGMAYGPRYGSYVAATYLIAGAVGMPVFASWSSGVETLTGPTAGYLLSFIPAAFVSGYLAQSGFANTIGRSFLAACIGTAIIFGIGVSVLSTSIGWHNAILFGLLPFVVSEPIKLLAVSVFVPRLWKKRGN